MKLSILLTLLPLALAAPAPAPLAPVITPQGATTIPGRYIVKFRDITDANFQNKLKVALGLLGKKAIHIYQMDNFGGFAADISDEVLKLLRALPVVEVIEKDVAIQANLGEVEHVEKKAFVSQNSAPWGLGRISQAKAGVSTYAYDNSAGAGTCVYVLDTGIETSHPEFEGRATFLANFADNVNSDGNGHGTHVAGTIGSKTYGVAKKAKLFAIKVLKADGGGAGSGVIGGINQAVNDFRNRAACKAGIINLSLGSSKSAAINSAAASAVKAGLFVAVAAGNAGQDASNTSPASEPSVFTVGATDERDAIAKFSNYGPGVDILAPGVSIISTYIGGKIASLSGTSMATPHIAGLAAYLSALEGKMSPNVLGNRMQNLAAKGKVTGLPSGTQNYLAFNGASGTQATQRKTSGST